MKIPRSQIQTHRCPRLPGVRLRVVRTQDGRAWFLACDVCEALGLESPAAILARLDSMERLTVLIEQRDGDFTQCALVNIAGLLALVGVRTATDPGLSRLREWLANELLAEVCRVVRPVHAPAPTARVDRKEVSLRV